MTDPSPPFEIDVQEAAEALRRDESVVLIDVRNPDEYQTARIEGAQLIPMPEFAARVEELEAYRDRPLIIHCHHGGRSARVVQFLRDRGFSTARNLTGGIDAWSQVIDPAVPRY